MIKLFDLKKQQKDQQAAASSGEKKKMAPGQIRMQKGASRSELPSYDL